jgi:hypothetical protein
VSAALRATVISVSVRSVKWGSITSTSLYCKQSQRNRKRRDGVGVRSHGMEQRHGGVAVVVGNLHAAPLRAQA